MKIVLYSEKHDLIAVFDSEWGVVESIYAKMWTTLPQLYVEGFVKVGVL